MDIFSPVLILGLEQVPMCHQLESCSLFHYRKTLKGNRSSLLRYHETQQLINKYVRNAEKGPKELKMN